MKPNSPTAVYDSDFVCERARWSRTACAGESFYAEHDGKRYCVLHFPGEKGDEFEVAVKRKLDQKDFDFRRVWFPRELSLPQFCFESVVDFSDAFFQGSVNFGFAVFQHAAVFTGAQFNDDVGLNFATFQSNATFANAEFKNNSAFVGTNFNAETIFNHARFGGEANFILAEFKDKAHFKETKFKYDVTFAEASFISEATFDEAIFSSGIDFFSTTFRDYVKFGGHRHSFLLATTADFQAARIDNPDRLFFHNVELLPHWFVNVDSHKFDFSNVTWLPCGYKNVLRALRDKHIPRPHNTLSIAYRNLAINADANHRYEEASDFRYMAMEAKRLEHTHGFAPWRLSWWYWLASGYSERALRAFLVLLGIWFVAGLFYTRVGFARWEPKLASEVDVVVAKRDDAGPPLKFSRAFTYSAAVMTFQKPEPRPATTAAQTVVLLETILGPVQAALLALAIRRKFMR